MVSKYSKKVSEKSKKPTKASKSTKKPDKETFRTGRAPAHSELIDRRVHVFVDDQNLFYGITNHEKDKDFRIDFGQMLAEVCRDTEGNVRPVASAYIAGVIPDDDTFWKAAEAKGFTVRRGYLGTGNRSKQDDAYLIAEIVETVWSQEGPATIVLVAGDADYVPALMKALARGWRAEVAFINRGVSISLEPQVHEFRTLNAGDFELLRK
ncbi:NYN domain-containing protein (plasmid) [Sphingomonas aurantiaca]